MDYWKQTAQRIYGWVLRNGIENLFHCPEICNTMFAIQPDAISEKLDKLKSRPDWNSVSQILTEDRLGHPAPSSFLPHTSNNLIQQYYHINVFEELSNKKISDISSIIEFGGGYGGLAKLIIRNNPSVKYRIYDLPELSHLQSMYLKNIEMPDVICSPNFPLKEKFELYIALFSLAEIPEEQREKYIPDCDYYLFGYGDHFEGSSNVDYFNELPNKFKQHKWKRHYICNARYLVGVRDVFI